MKVTGEVLVSRMWFGGFSPGERGWGGRDAVAVWT